MTVKHRVLLKAAIHNPTIAHGNRYLKTIREILTHTRINKWAEENHYLVGGKTKAL